MKQTTILLDLKVAMNNGFCGIAKENRLIFKMLSQENAIKTSGLLISNNPSSVFTNYKNPNSRIDAIEQANRFLHESLFHDDLLKNRILTKLKLASIFVRKKRYFELYPIDSIFHPVIWRNVFNKSLDAANKNIILNNEFYFTDLCGLHLQTRAYFFKNIALNTNHYNFAIFLEPTLIKVSPQTHKIVRYHDAIPISDPDFGGNVYSKTTLNKLKYCVNDSYFVCNSEPTRAALLNLYPQIEHKTFVIPIALSSNYTKTLDFDKLKKIMQMRMSSQLLTAERMTEIKCQLESLQKLDYFFNLAAFDPKKNHLQLIKAWENFNYQYPGKYKLVIAANKGWFSQEVEDKLRPHVEAGNIIHLANVATEEMSYLFSHATAFLFPSFAEGFGIPPLEAAQCECPAIISDIPAHRWVMADAALYADPYDVDSLVSEMKKIACLTHGVHLKQEMITKALKRVELYTESTLSNQWMQLLDTIKFNYN